MTRTFFWRYCTVFTLLLALWGCEGNRQPIKIAFIGAVSGGKSEVAVSTRNGALQMIDEVNAQGGINGREVQLDIFDNKGDINICRNIFSQVQRENYQYVIGPLFSQMADVALEVLSESDLLLMSPTMATEVLSDRDDYFIRTSSTINPQAALLAEHIGKQEKNSVSVVIDTSNRKLTVGLSNYFKKSIKKYDVVLKSSYSINSDEKVDFVEIANILKNDNPQSILLCMSALDAAYLAQQLRRSGFDADLYGISWTQTNDLITHGGEAVEGMVLIAVLESENVTSKMHSFRSEYQRRYGVEASFTSVLGYSATHVLLDGMRRAKSLKNADIKTAIIEKSQYQILGRSMSINEFGDLQGNYSLVQVKNKAFTPVHNETP